MVSDRAIVLTIKIPALGIVLSTKEELVKHELNKSIAQLN